MGKPLKYCLLSVVIIVFAAVEGNCQLFSKELRPGYCYTTFEEIGDYVFYHDAFMPVDDTYHPVGHQEIIEIVIEPSREVWEKRKIRLDCDLPEPEDCYALCLRTIPPITIKMVADPLQVSAVRIDKEKWPEKEKLEWVEVPCGKLLNQNLIKRIGQQLKEKGYYGGDFLYGLNTEFKEALIRFQTDHQLPIGLIDYETLDFLGIVYTTSE